MVLNGLETASTHIIVSFQSTSRQNNDCHRCPKAPLISAHMLAAVGMVLTTGPCPHVRRKLCSTGSKRRLHIQFYHFGQLPVSIMTTTGVLHIIVLLFLSISGQYKYCNMCGKAPLISAHMLVKVGMVPAAGLCSHERR